MKLGAAGTTLTILLLAVCLTPMPVTADSLSLNISEGIVGTNVTIPSVTGYGLGNYELYWGETDILIGQGELKQGVAAIAFIVPEAARGKHKVTLKVAGNFFNTDFTVIPAIGLSSSQGTVGSNLTIAGKGFNVNESNIQVLFDGNPVQSGIVAGSKGSWQITVKVPASSGGQHTIDAGGTTPASEVEDKTFTVNPEIEINPASGWVNTVVGIYGSGFSSGETNIKVTYDGGTVKSDIAADAKGSWQSSFSIPSSSRGGHEIRAYGAMTNESNIQSVSFSVSPGMKIEPVSGYLGGAIYVGDSLYVSGVGFDANETGIKVTYDGALAVSDITADTKGSWSGILSVPSSSRGEHIIDASGEVTRANDIQDAIIIVSPKVELNPSTSVAIGTDVTIHGTGFAPNQVITISYDGAKIASNSATDAKGIFTTSFKIPQGKAGDHTVTVTDPTAAVFSVNLSVESSPPPTPNLISPEAGSEFGSFGKTPVTFRWSAVEDPSGVYYLLEISPSSDFAGTVIRKESLAATEYTLGDDEALTKGNYYWRVRAVDGAGNQSDWTNGQLFRIGGFDWWLILLAVVGVIVVVGIVWRFVHMGRHGKWK